MTNSEKILVEQINGEYGSVSKMIHSVNNKVEDLINYGGRIGMDRGDVLNEALRTIPYKFHEIFFKYHHTTARP